MDLGVPRSSRGVGTKAALLRLVLAQGLCAQGAIQPCQAEGTRPAAMDYGKSGSPKTGKGTPRHHEHNAKGSEKNPFGKPAPKTALLARLKAAADARKPR